MYCIQIYSLPQLKGAGKTGKCTLKTLEKCLDLTLRKAQEPWICWSCNKSTFSVSWKQISNLFPLCFFWLLILIHLLIYLFSVTFQFVVPIQGCTVRIDAPQSHLVSAPSALQQLASLRAVSSCFCVLFFSCFQGARGPGLKARQSSS